MEYLEQVERLSDPTADTTPPWEDVSLKPIPVDSAPLVVLGEHLRVFKHECVWAYSRERSTTYDEAKKAVEKEYPAEFIRHFNAATFEATAIARGLEVTDELKHWQVMTDKGDFNPFDEDSNEVIERARRQGQERFITLKLGPKRWTYEIDLKLMIQRNLKTKKDRPIRCVEREGRAPGKLTQAELQQAIHYFVVDLDTLPAAPPCCCAPDGR